MLAGFLVVGKQEVKFSHTQKPLKNQGLFSFGCPS